MVEIMTRCWSLSVKQKMELIQWLKKTMYSAPDYKSLDRYEEYNRAMCEVLGVTEIPDNRERPNVYARAIITYQMVLDGKSLSQIAKYVGRDRATLVSLNNKVIDALKYPTMYSDLIKMFNKFQNAIQ